MEENNFYALVAWLSGVWTQTGSVTNLSLRLFRRFGEASTPEGECGLCIILCPGLCLTTEEKITENPQSGHSCSASLCPARFVWSTWPSSNGLNWPAGPRRSWFTRRAEVPTLGPRRYLLICRTKGFPTSAKLESKLAVIALMWSRIAEHPDPRESACYWGIKGRP
jgi:hypothetical protein